MNINQFINNHPTITCQQELKEICRSLEEINIVYFAHVHLKGKSITGISLCPDFFKIYLEKEFYKYDLHMANLPINKQHIVWSTVGIKKQTREMHKCFTSFNQDHTFSIIKTSPTGNDYYHFAAKIEHDFMNNRYLHLLEELYCFINYFTEKAQQNKKIKQAYTMKMPIINSNGGFLFDEQLLHNTSFQNFSRNLKTKRFYHNQMQYITKRELECLYWASKGKGFIEISAILQITERTVKEHFKNIKEKLNCKTLFQAGMLYKELKMNLELITTAKV